MPRAEAISKSARGTDRLRGSVPRRGLTLSLIVALIVQTGSHLALLQFCAWASMAAGNLQNHSVSQALNRTFDGRHPCPLCLKIRKARSAGAQMGSENRETKVVFSLGSGVALRIKARSFDIPPGAAADCRGWRAPPLFPPPKPLQA